MKAEFPTRVMLESTGYMDPFVMMTAKDLEEFRSDLETGFNPSVPRRVVAAIGPILAAAVESLLDRDQLRASLADDEADDARRSIIRCVTAAQLQEGESTTGRKIVRSVIDLAYEDEDPPANELLSLLKSAADELHAISALTALFFRLPSVVAPPFTDESSHGQSCGWFECEAATDDGSIGLFGPRAERQRPEWNSIFLDTVATLKAHDPDRAMSYRLAVFTGATPNDLAELLGRPVPFVRDEIDAASAFVLERIRAPNKGALLKSSVAKFVSPPNSLKSAPAVPVLQVSGLVELGLMENQPGQRSTVILRDFPDDPRKNVVFEEFAAKYGPRIHSLCRSRGIQDADSEDLTATVLLRFLERNTFKDFIFEDKDKVDRWLRKTVNNAVVCFFRERNRKPDAWSLGNPDAQASLERVATEMAEDLSSAYQRDRAIVQTARIHVEERVDPKTWHAFRLLMDEQLPVSEVEKQTSMTDTTIRTIRSRLLRM